MTLGEEIAAAVDAARTRVLEFAVECLGTAPIYGRPMLKAHMSETDRLMALCRLQGRVDGYLTPDEKNDAKAELVKLTEEQ